MNHLDRNWNDLFGEYTTDETAWYGQWVTYSPDQQVINSQRVIRSFRSNADNTVITHINRYVDASGNNIEEKTWQIDRETCNQSNGVIHPARTWMRALALGVDATAWTSQKLIPGTPFGVQLSFRDDNWGTSAAIGYADGQLNQILHVREHLGCFADEALSSESSDISGDWIGKQRSMTPDLSISPEEDLQLSFDQIRDHHKIIALPGNLIVIFPESVTGAQPMQLAIGHQTANQPLKYLAAHYTTGGVFTLLVSATLHS